MWLQSCFVFHWHGAAISLLRHALCVMHSMTTVHWYCVGMNCMGECNFSAVCQAVSSNNVYPLHVNESTMQL